MGRGQAPGARFRGGYDLLQERGPREARVALASRGRHSQGEDHGLQPGWRHGDNVRANRDGVQEGPRAEGPPHQRSRGSESVTHEDLRRGVREVCSRFPNEYWRGLDAERRYPEEFVAAITGAGYLGALIPEEYGGMGLDLSAACAILEEVNLSGANAGPAHAQMYTMGTLLTHGSEEQKREYLPRIARGDLRLQAFAVTEPEAGTDTTSIRTTAKREGDHYVVNGRKIYISRVEQSDLMILLARTDPAEEVEKRSHGLSVFLVDLRDAEGLTVKPRRVMMNNATNELVLEDLRVPAGDLIGEGGGGFRYILDGMNAERILIAAECIGDGRWFIEKATGRAGEREVFGRPIGENQGVQFPIARAYASVKAASLMVEMAASLFDRGEPCGA